MQLDNGVHIVKINHLHVLEKSCKLYVESKMTNPQKICCGIDSIMVNIAAVQIFTD